MRLRRTSRDRHRYRNRNEILGENQFLGTTTRL